jgi:FtsH-binding integral membrane protein
MTGIYNWMMIGLLVSSGAAYFSVASGLVTTLAQRGLLFWVVLLAPLALIFGMAAAMRSASVSTVRWLYILFTVLEGLGLSTVLIKYTGASVASTFVATAAAFAGLSLWGYTTKRNLSGIGSFLIMALVGLLVVMILNAFFPSPAISLLIGIAGVLIFAGLTAYDTQKLKEAYHSGMGEDEKARITIWGALDLYLDFINLFLFLLRFIGVKADD